MQRTQDIYPEVVYVTPIRYTLRSIEYCPLYLVLFLSYNRYFFTYFLQILERGSWAIGREYVPVPNFSKFQIKRLHLYVEELLLSAYSEILKKLDPMDAFVADGLYTKQWHHAGRHQTQHHVLGFKTQTCAHVFLHVQSSFQYIFNSSQCIKYEGIPVPLPIWYSFHQMLQQLVALYLNKRKKWNKAQARHMRYVTYTTQQQHTG